jgi:hypothetical protein
MKLNARSLLIAYVCFTTLALVATLGYLVAGSKPAIELPVRSAQPVAKISDQKTASPAKKGPTEAWTPIPGAKDVQGLPETKSIWKNIDTGDFRQFVQNLRSIGCPEATVRDIVVAELREEFNHRRSEVLKQEPIPYWEAGYDEDESELPEYAAVGEQERQMATDLLGSAAGQLIAGVSVDEVAGFRLGPEFAEKQPLVESLYERMAHQVNALMELPLGDETPEERNRRLNAVTQEFETALAQALTPAERQAYELRHSPAAIAMRESLRESGVSVSEKEFHELYRARQQFEQISNQAADQQTDLTPAWEAYMAASQRVLGEERSWSMNASRGDRTNEQPSDL